MLQEHDYKVVFVCKYNSNMYWSCWTSVALLYILLLGISNILGLEEFLWLTDELTVNILKLKYLFDYFLADF